MSLIQILVVDDFFPWQRFVRRMLERENDLSIVAAVNDGINAVEAAAECQPDVILMDISLPGISGFQAAQQIRRMSPKSRVLFVSQHREVEFVEAAFQAGGMGYVLKVDSNSDLLAGIRAVLRGEQFVSHSMRNRSDLP